MPATCKASSICSTLCASRKRCRRSHSGFRHGKAASSNGLPIVSIEPDLDRYYWDNVIGGPGAFMVAADSYETFAAAILKKLISEIAMNDR